MNKHRSFFILFTGVLILLIVLLFSIEKDPKNQEFDKERAYQDVITQVNFGPRVPGSPAHQKTIEYIQSELENNHWTTEIQEAEINGQTIFNVIAKRGHSDSWIIFGAHYDSRFFASNEDDPESKSQPVPGANDGASGVAVLLELSRILPKDIDKEIWLVFFDAEDQGNIDNWDWILGSRAFVRELVGKPSAVVIIDMIGDSDLSIYREISSDPALTTSIWKSAKELGFSSQFIDQEKYNRDSTSL
ncbi:MAG: M28 family peptidase [Chloroflexi bacterium]|nr:M28 family peptidase [Chloroflexota bacterium]